MQVTHVPLTESSLLHPLAKAYLNEEPGLREYYAWAPGFEGIKEAIEARKNTLVDRELLSRIIEEQYSNIDASFSSRTENSAVLENLRLLKEENTFTITTGHQLNIF